LKYNLILPDCMLAWQRSNIILFQQRTYAKAVVNFFYFYLFLWVTDSYFLDLPIISSSSWWYIFFSFLYCNRGRDRAVSRVVYCTNHTIKAGLVNIDDDCVRQIYEMFLRLVLDVWGASSKITSVFKPIDRWI